MLSLDLESQWKKHDGSEFFDYDLDPELSFGTTVGTIVSLFVFYALVVRLALYFYEWFLILGLLF